MEKETENKLKSKNIRPTSMRILIYDYLRTLTVALSLTEIEHHFHKADRITIYRTLQTFEEKGLVHSIVDDNGTKYKMSAEGRGEAHRDAHLHFYCKKCGQTTCKESITFPQLPNAGFRIDEIQIMAKGICEKCLDKE